MTDVDEIICYIKSLKKGFDKQLFESKIEDLAYVAHNTGIEDDDFHTLFKVWLNLNIPIRKWISLGTCILPQDNVGQNTIEYALRWLLANQLDQSFYQRIGFLLDWLTAAMDSDSIDMVALDMGYEVFYNFLSFEVLTPHVIKLIYVLTKPHDVTRQRVILLLDHAKKREVKKNLLRQLQVIIGLFKTYKPECVPEDVPSISVHTVFKKLNVGLLEGFHKCQTRRNNKRAEKQRLLWINPMNMKDTNKKVFPLIPNMKFLHVGSTQYNQKEPEKTYLDFSEPVSLLQYSLNHNMSRPTRLRTLLCNPTGHTLLSLTDQQQYSFFMYDLHHILSECFLSQSPHNYVEKASFLNQLATFQSTLMQGLPVVTRFLAQLLPFWNELDYFPEIMSLLVWVNVESPEFVEEIFDKISKIYCRSHPMQQCLIVRVLTSLYGNLIYTSSRPSNCFTLKKPSEEKFKNVISIAGSSISEMCCKGMQINPEDIRIVHTSLRALVSCAQSSEWIGRGMSVGAVPRPFLLALPLLSKCAILLESLAELLMRYKLIISAYKENHGKDQIYIERMKVLKLYSMDFINCLSGQFLSGRERGFVFSNLQPLLISKLTNSIPNVEEELTIKNHLAFAPYTYMRIQGTDRVIEETIVHEAVYQEFEHLNNFVTLATSR
ncbi:unnamed protein product [Leptosia nina]|uniref:Centromere protein I n=1 Tax=Leptosia nina TaxID=320188 RepID=A0AAV1J6Y6_9NEOP